MPGSVSAGNSFDEYLSHGDFCSPKEGLCLEGTFLLNEYPLINDPSIDGFFGDISLFSSQEAWLNMPFSSIQDTDESPNEAAGDATNNQWNGSHSLQLNHTSHSYSPLLPEPGAEPCPAPPSASDRTLATAIASFASQDIPQHRLSAPSANTIGFVEDAERGTVLRCSRAECSNKTFCRLPELKRHNRTIHRKENIYCPVPNCKRSTKVSGRDQPFKKARRDKLDEHVRNMHPAWLMMRGGTAVTGSL